MSDDSSIEYFTYGGEPEAKQNPEKEVDQNQIDTATQIH